MKPWPFPADTLTDRLRRIALMYRQVAADAGAPVDRVDAHLAQFGETWISPVVAVEDDELVTAAEAESQFGIPATRVRQWKARNMLEPVSSAPTRYRVGDVRRLEAAMRTRRRR